MTSMPEGTVTFLFSDVEASTQLLERHGAAMGNALARHHSLFEDVVTRHGGVVFETVGDAVYAAFARPADAVGAALDAHRALATEDWGPIGRLAVRIALHTGTVERRGNHYFGSALFRAARLQVCGYGEQTLVSGATARLVADTLPDGSALRSLGTHRLKDLGEPEDVFQLVHSDLRSDFPALKSLDAHPHNLPIQVSTFIGRDSELREVTDLLGDHRLVTLIGPGGIGKTRLACQTAADLIERFGDGVFFIDLAPVRDPELAAAAMATTLGLREQGAEPIRATLGQHLRERSVLLVLDNLEQLLPAFGSTVAELLATAPDLWLLATSRAPLRIRAEREYHVPALATGRADQLEPEPPAAVTLFVERAHAIGADLNVNAETGPLVAAICERLDGLPLAIELAAARLRVFGLSQLNDRLAHRLPVLGGGARDLPERQQTLRAAIAWSTDLLSAAERQLFARLGVFVGGFTLEAAEAIAGQDLDADAVDALGTLVEHSLVRRVEGPSAASRYTMLETIREAALEELERSGVADAIRERHAECLLKLAESQQWRTAGDAWREAMVAEANNIRSALEWAISARRGSLVSALAAATWSLWNYLGAWAEGLRWSSAALDYVASDDPRRAEAVHLLGIFAHGVGERDRARAAWQEALALRRAAGDRFGAARALHNLGMSSADPNEGMRLLDEALAELTAISGPMANTRYTLANAIRRRGNLDHAAAVYREALEDARAERDDDIVGSAHFQLAQLALVSGDLSTAWEHAREATKWTPDELGEVASGWALVARVAQRSGKWSEVSDALRRALTALEGGEWANRGPAAATLEVLGEAMAAAGENSLAALVLAKSKALRHEHETWLPDQQREAEAIESSVRAHADQAEFDRMWSRGTTAETSEVIAVGKQWLESRFGAFARLSGSS